MLLTMRDDLYMEVVKVSMTPFASLQIPAIISLKAHEIRPS